MTSRSRSAKAHAPRPVAPGLRIVPRSAVICTGATRNRAACLRDYIFRAKFNTALGIQAQGLCLLK
jgi:hypothetical protein